MRAVATADVREQFAKLGSEPLSMTPAEFSRYVRKETEDNARVVKAAGIKAP
jgi:tripartite-type tricarboxylate transporter receptor subunit TctC